VGRPGVPAAPRRGGVGTTRFAALALLLLAAADAPPTPQELQTAEQAHAADISAQQAAAARARVATEQEKTLQQARVAAAAMLRQAEDALSEASARVADLTRQRADAEARLAARAAALAPMLPVIERLSLYPAETLLAVPMPPEQAVRGVLVLGALTRTLERQAVDLRAEQGEVASLRAEVDAALPGLAQAQAAQGRLAQSLDASIANAHRLHRVAEDAANDAARRAAADAARAQTIRAAIARIEAERSSAEDKARADAAAAAAPKPGDDAPAGTESRQRVLVQPQAGGLVAGRQLTAPVAGLIVRAFGAATDAGPASGVSYLAPPNARVVSPCGGRVVFAGPFRSFGLLAIVDCGGGYHFVMSGLDRLDVQVGQAVQPAEPVGIMPSWDPQDATETRPTLYLELRKDGAPVNPAPFLRARS